MFSLSVTGYRGNDGLSLITEKGTEAMKEDKEREDIDEEERRQEIEDVLKITAAVVAAGIGLLLMTVVIPWFKRQFAGSLFMAVIISAFGVGAYFLSDMLVKKEIISPVYRLTLAKLILLAFVLIGAWFG